MFLIVDSQEVTFMFSTIWVSSNMLYQFCIPYSLAFSLPKMPPPRLILNLLKSLKVIWGILGGLDGQASACNVGDWVQSLGCEDPPEKGKATHSSVLVWRIPWTKVTVHGASESDIREWLALSLYFLKVIWNLLLQSHLISHPESDPSTHQIPGHLLLSWSLSEVCLDRCCRNHRSPEHQDQSTFPALLWSNLGSTVHISWQAPSVYPVLAFLESHLPTVSPFNFQPSEKTFFLFLVFSKH